MAEVISSRSILRNKFINLISNYMLTDENHTNFSMILKTENLIELEEFLERYDLNLLGFAVAPYNYYGDSCKYCVVLEDLSDDYRITWHHITDKWRNNFIKQLEG